MTKKRSSKSQTEKKKKKDPPTPPNPDLHSLSGAFQTYLNHDKKEANHFADVTRSYQQYVSFAMAHWANQQYRLHSLPESQRFVLPSGLRRDTPEFMQRTTAFKEAAIRNQFCLDCILRHAGIPHSQASNTMKPIADDAQVSKVSSVLKSLARDWSSDGRAEREMAYTPIINQIKRYLPSAESTLIRPKICVPGSGEYGSSSIVCDTLVETQPPLFHFIVSLQKVWVDLLLSLPG